MTLTEEAPEVVNRELSLQDRCDSCKAQAFVLVKLVSGELIFCGHHFNKYELNLRESAYEIVDEREYINKKSESSN
jgi:hypothetical protein